MTEAPTTFVVMFKRATRLIIGMQPSGDVGPKNDVATLDISEYDNVERYNPAYLSADGQHVVAEPPA